MSLAMFYEKNVIKTRSSSANEEYRRKRTSKSLSTTDEEPVKHSKPRSASFANPFHQVVGYVQRKLSHANDKQKQEYTSIQEEQ